MEKESSLTQQEKSPENLENILANIMTAEEYSQKEHETPYIFKLKAGEKELHYFGSEHTSDPTDPILVQMETSFNQADPDIIFIEGMNVRKDRDQFNEKVKEVSREKLVQRFGEPGLALKLAVEKGIEWQSPEPRDEDLYNYLREQGFSKDQIFAWNIFLVLPQYHRQMNKKGFEQYAQSYIEHFKQATNWPDFDYSYERAIKLGEEIMGRTIDVENETEPLDDPIPWPEKIKQQTVLNRIGEAATLFRDRKIVSDLAQAMENHQRIFVVYGASHAVMQEPALKKLLENY